MERKEFKIQLEQRTMDFSVELILFLKSFPYDWVDQVLGKQVLRSGTSIAANYHEANRAESKKDFIHKIGIVEKEASETQMWFRLMNRTWRMKPEQVDRFRWLETECSEFVALFTSISKSSKGH